MKPNQVKLVSLFNKKSTFDWKINLCFVIISESFSVASTLKNNEYKEHTCTISKPMYIAGPYDNFWESL